MLQKIFAKLNFSPVLFEKTLTCVWLEIQNKNEWILSVNFVFLKNTLICNSLSPWRYTSMLSRFVLMIALSAKNVTWRKCCTYEELRKCFRDSHDIFFVRLFGFLLCTTFNMRDCFQSAAQVIVNRFQLVSISSSVYQNIQISNPY